MGSGKRLIAALVALACCGFGVQTSHAQVDLRIMANVIREEATRASMGPEGRPLPLLGQWNTGRHANSRGWTPEQQLRLLEAGHCVLPWFAHPPTDAVLSEAALAAFAAEYEGPIKRAAELKLPITFISAPWEYSLSATPYLDLPPAANPNVVRLDGAIEKRVSPFGAVAPWREVGRTYTDNPQMKQIQAWYPDPPLVMFLSNTEHPKLRWTEVETCRQYLERYGKRRDDAFKRQVVAEGWVERYRALQDGMRSGMTSPQWQAHAIFVGYSPFIPLSLGRYTGWPNYALHTRGWLSPAARMWDGGSVEMYANDWTPTTDFTAWSPQTEMMNLAPVQQEAYRMNPNFWFELSVWDGYDGPEREKGYPSKPAYYRSRGQVYTPERYAAMAQYGMWLLRPRVVREYRGWTFNTEEGMPYFLALAGAVDRVYTQPTLRDFWRKGELVPNRAHQSVFNVAIPREYEKFDRWFLLDSDANPREFPWEYHWQVNVFSLALAQGKAPTRQWLVYAHSPRGSRQGVHITIPSYREITVTAPLAGAFYLVEESTGAITEVK